MSASPTATKEEPPTADSLDAKYRRRVAFASTIGTTIEFYDFYAYATAAVAVFPLLFFPATGNPTVALLQSFATFGLAFVARPLGSIIFGHYGDRLGRKTTLVGALLTMGIATFIIGVLPTYSQVGFVAPLLLAIMRFCQGLGLGGEWQGAALLTSETAQSGKRASAAMWPQFGAPFGFLLANGFFLVLVTTLGYKRGDTTGPFMEWGWRLPFLASAIMVIVGLFVRLQLEETPVFQHAVDNNKKAQRPLGEVFRTAVRPMVIGTLVQVGFNVLFYLGTTWILSYGIADANRGDGLGFEYLDFLKIQLITIVAFIIGIPVSSRLADKYGRKPTLTVISGLMVLFGLSFPFFLSIERASTASVLVFLAIGMLLMGLIFGPMSAVIPELFPTNVRYTGSGIAYNAAALLGAATAPFIATYLVAEFDVSAVGFYLTGVSTISLLAILIMPELSRRDLTES